MVPLVIPNDEIALQENITFMLIISVSATPSFVVGDFEISNGGNLHQSTMVTIVDDDSMFSVGIPAES